MSGSGSARSNKGNESRSSSSRSSRESLSRSSSNKSSGSEGGEDMSVSGPSRIGSLALADVVSFRVDKLDFNLPPIMQMQTSISSPPDTAGPTSRTENADPQAYQPIDELLRLRFQMEELKQRKEALEDDVVKWAVVHKAISNLYLEVSDKFADAAVLEEERSKLENLEIVVIVDYIRTELRGMMGIKAEFNKEILIELEKKQAEFDRQLDEERRKMADVTKTNEELQQKLDAANAQLSVINSAKEQDLQEANLLQKQIEEELLATKELMQQKDSGIEDKQNQLTKLHQQIKVKDSKLSKLTELEARNQQLTGLHDSERQQHQIEVQKLKDKCASLNERANYTAEAKKKLEDELKTISEKMIDIKKHNYFNDYSEAARRLERLAQTVDMQSVQLRRGEEELRKSKQLNDELSAKVKELERECGRSQFSSVPDIKKKEKPKAISEEQYRKVINENPHYVDAYKNLLREKEAQIKDLTARLRALLVQANVGVKKPSGSRRQLTTTGEPLVNSKTIPNDSATSLPEQWVNKQMDIMHKATNYAPQKQKEIKESDIPQEETEMDDADGADEGGREKEKDKEKWMQGIKTPNMRTIKILKSPSEKELSVISRNPLFNNAADVTRQYMKPHKRTGGPS